MYLVIVIFSLEIRPQSQRPMEPETLPGNLLQTPVQSMLKILSLK